MKLQFGSQSLIGFLLFIFFIYPPTITAQKKEITFEDLHQKNTFSVRSVPGFNVLKNGEDFSRLENNGSEIALYKLKTGKKIKSIYNKPADAPTISHYTFSNDEKKLLLFSERESIYRRSALYHVSVYNIATGETEKLINAKVMHATFSPDGDKVAFVLKNNLFVKELSTSRITPITQDGKVNEIINGSCDWVYEEEFGFTKAFSWSPDGNRIAYFRFDERRVPEFTMQFFETAQPYPTEYTYKYPKAGEENSLVSIHIYDFNKNNSVQAAIANKPGHTLSEPEYIPRIQWTPSGNDLCIFMMNRWQNKLELQLFNVSSEKTELIYKEENKYYIDINNRLTPSDNIHFLSNGHSFLINSQRDGYNHVYIWDWKTKQTTQITSGKWDVDQVMSVDLKRNQLYYTAAKTSPMDRNLYKINFNGKNDICLTPEKGYHQISGFAGGLYFLDAYSTAYQVPVYKLIDNKGKTVRVLEENKTLSENLKKYNLGELEFFTIPNADGIELNAWKILPPDFDKNKKYPVLMYQYSGPGSQQVLNKFPLGNYFWHQMLAQKGYIIVCVDGTGTGMRGWEFQNKTYLQLGKYETRDQIDAARFLQKQSYVDANRIGIWGWSYGGFMSSTCLMKGKGIFSTAIAVAPVSNWRYYDNIYTERYMRRPEDNKSGYDDNAPELMTNMLSGKLFIIHGMADDNVHFQNAAALVKTLVENNKQFETAYYPNKNHSIVGGVTREQLYRTMTNYILREL